MTTPLPPLGETPPMITDRRRARMKIEVRDDCCVVEFYDQRGVIRDLLTVSDGELRLDAPWWLPRSYPDPSDRAAVLRYVEWLIKKRYPERAAREAAAPALEVISQLIAPALFEAEDLASD